MKRFTLAQLMVLVLVAAVGTAIAVPAIARANVSRRRTACQNNLHGLWTAHHGYVQMNDDFRGGDFHSENLSLSGETGSRFWLHLARGPRPFIDVTRHNLYDCPASDAAGGIENCEYRGPSPQLTRIVRPPWPDAEPVGADRVANHGGISDPERGGNVLLYSGEVLHAERADRLWRRAAETTRE